MPVDGVDDVDVDMTVMTDEERRPCATRLAAATPGAATPGAATATAGHGEAPGTQSPSPAPASKTRVLGISSGKGGVGKSSVTVNTAVALARLGHEVGRPRRRRLRLLGPEDARHRPGAGRHRRHDRAAGRPRREASSPSGSSWRRTSPSSGAGPMLHKALEQFLADVYWGEPDFLLVDMPPGTGDVALSMAQYLPRSEILRRHHAPAGGPAGGPAHGAAWPGRSTCRCAASSRTCRGSPATTASATSCSAPAAAQLLADRARRAARSARSRSSRPARGRRHRHARSRSSDPDGEAAQAFDAIAERIEANGPKRVYRSELTIQPRRPPPYR